MLLRDNSGFARGNVARLDGDGRVFTYFFGPKLCIAEGTFDNLHAQDAVLVGKCGDLGLLEGAWTIAGELKAWNREEWPLPALYREDEIEKVAWLSYYDDENLDFIREERVAFGRDRHVGHPDDGLMGYGAAEISLTKLLS